MTHVFISYSKKNKEYARAFADHLEANGFNVWIDDQIDYGDSWERSMFKAVDDCAAFVVIMTPESYQSDWVLRECQYAERREKPQFPVLRAGEEFPRYMTHQWLDARGGQLPSDEFLDRLSESAPRQETSEKDAAKVTSNRYDASPLKLPSDLKLPLLEWCYIPAGKVTIENVVCDIAAFWMAKYPVTVAQYEAFVKEDGYNKREYWTEAGWKWKSDKTQPQSGWHESDFHQPNHPVIGVTWYEALAFAHWLSGRTKGQISLPSESQWQRAAQGDDGRAYPWGHQFDKNRFNSQESDSAKTTPVNQYPNGASPFGVMDMSGNVLEWCLSKWASPYRFPEENNESKIDIPVLRGGSWGNFGNNVSITNRYRVNPDKAYDFLGFRCTIFVS